MLPSNQDATVFYSCSNDKTVKIFDISKAAAVMTFTDHEYW